MGIRQTSTAGAVARSVFRIRGDDIDAGAPTLEYRLLIIAHTLEVLLSTVRGNGRIRLSRVSEKIEKYAIRLRSRQAARDRRAAVLAPKLRLAAAWREVGIQERYTSAHLHPMSKLVIWVFLGGLDFYVFAQAYAFVDDVADFTVQWWLGGLLGLTVFGAGLALARQLKVLAVSQEQLAHLGERASSTEMGGLVPLRVSIAALVGTSVVFLLLCGAGLVVRVEGSSEPTMGVLALQALIPLLVLIVEAYLHDPLERYGPAENWIDRLLRARQARHEQEHDRVLQAVETAVERIREQFAIEEYHARTIAADLGMRLPAPLDEQDDRPLRTVS